MKIPASEKIKECREKGKYRLDAKSKAHLTDTDIANFQSYFSMLLIVPSDFQMRDSCLPMLWKMDLLCTTSLKNHYVVTQGFISGHLIYALKLKKHLIIGIPGMFINYIN